MTEKEIIKEIESQGVYLGVAYVNGLGYCGMQRFLFTVGIVVDIQKEFGDNYMHAYRFCYPPEYITTILYTLLAWRLSEKPITEDPGDEFWIKKKGRDRVTGQAFDDSNPKIRDKHIDY